MRLIGLSILGVIAAAHVASPASAQDGGTPTIAAKTAGYEQVDGLFPLYRDPQTGKLFMEIGADQLDQEFIAFSYSENGVLEGGTFRGAYRDNRIISLRKSFEDIEFVEENTGYYFDEDNALSRAADANISPAVLASLPIIAVSGGDRYLIDADKLFLSESLHQVKPSPNPNAPRTRFTLGNLSPDKTKVLKTRGYPDNTDVVVRYVYDNPAPIGGTSGAVTDRRNVSIVLQHSFLEMPDDGFEPRLDDYRVGYFTDQVTDMTSMDAAPYRDLVNRWRLEKKDPEAALSDPVKPITWWIENTTPVEYREIIREAALQWNIAFEKAGFTNAMDVKIQPDDADWDAGDVRYNVLRWTSSPQPPFGGYGPSFTNPRTGEILGADIMLEYTFLTNRVVTSDVFPDGGEDAPHRLRHCSFAHDLQTMMQFGISAYEAAGAPAQEIDRLVDEGLHYLILHELGHTLGLNHNMKASFLHGPEEVHDPSVTKGAPTASVMDYPAINIAPVGQRSGDYYHTVPGAYDLWAIEFGYRPNLEGESRDALLARSSEPGHIFGNDADDMRAAGRGIDPRVMINDMSTDPVAYGQDRIKLVKATQAQLVDTFGRDEDSWQKLLRAYQFTLGQHRAMAVVMSRQIGGVYVDRSAPGQSDGSQPYVPVPRATQKAAMDALAADVFDGEAFMLPEELIVRLQQQRRGFNFGGTTEDPKLHANALVTQEVVLDHLLHPVVLRRMTDTQLYGGDYPPSEMLVDLNDAIFGKDLTKGGNTFRRNLQVHYAERLAQMMKSSSYDANARVAILIALRDIDSRLGFWPDLLMPADSRAHREQITRILDEALNR